MVLEGQGERIGLTPTSEPEEWPYLCRLGLVVLYLELELFGLLPQHFPMAVLAGADATEPTVCLQVCKMPCQCASSNT